MSVDQSGKRLPFATPDGKPVNPEANPAKPTDFGKSNGRSVNADATPPRLPSEYAPTENADTKDAPNTTYQPHLISRKQTPGSVEQRANPTSIPAGGPTTKMDPGRASRLDASTVARGAPGARNPFKNMK
jgi:hypothetical protein